MYGHIWEALRSLSCESVPGALAVNLAPPRVGPLPGQITVKSPGLSERPLRMPKRGHGPLYVPRDRLAHGDFAGDRFYCLQSHSQTHRPGTNVFVFGAWSQGAGANFTSGELPARLAGIVMNPGDPLGRYRSYSLVIWSYNGLTLQHIPGYEDHVPEDLREILLRESDVIVESNLALEADAECITDSCEIIPLKRNANGVFDLAEARAKATSKRFQLHAGTVDLDLLGGKKPKKVRGFREWTSDDTLTSMLHPKFTENDFDSPQPPPRGSDTYGAPAFTITPRSGGPVINGSGAIISAGCDEERIYVLETSSGELFTLQPDANPHSPELLCVKMLQLEQVEQLAVTGGITCLLTLSALQLPRAERAWMNGPKELMRSDIPVRPRRHPSLPAPALTTHNWSQVSVKSSEVIGVRMSVNESAASDLAQVFDPNAFYTFSGSIIDGGFRPCRPVCRADALKIVRDIVMPERHAFEGLAQVSLQQAIINAADQAKQLEPLVASLGF